MTRIWKEKLDVKRHRDHMVTSVGRTSGGREIRPPRDNLIERWVYFVRVCSFTFQFQSLYEIEACLEYFSQKLHPSERKHIEFGERWLGWYERLPMWLFEEPKRQKVVKALQQALREFDKESP